ncbi:protein piccolo isoform X2 [Dermacentor albipictus]|uniref:protein piccolo isoform X2 n=1 Tax=Dermacentor albipictus TaxID=60249 RepID=UPI0038FD365D
MRQEHRCRHRQSEHHSPLHEPRRQPDVPDQQAPAPPKGPVPAVAAGAVPAGLGGPGKATEDAAQRAKSAQLDAGKDGTKRPPPAAVPAAISVGPILVPHAPPKEQGPEVNRAPDGHIVGPSSTRVPRAPPLKPTLPKDGKPSPTTSKKLGPINVVTAKEASSSRPQFAGGRIVVKGGITPQNNVVDMPAASTAQTVGRSLPTLANAASTKFGAVPETQQKPPVLHEPNVKPPTDALLPKVPHVSPAGASSKAAATADTLPRVDQQVNKAPFRAVDKIQNPALFPEKQLGLPTIPKGQISPPRQEAPGAPLRGPLMVQGAAEGLKKDGPIRQQGPASPKTTDAAKPSSIGTQDVLHKTRPRGSQVLLRPMAPKKVEAEPFKKVLNGQPITTEVRALNHDQRVADAKLPKPLVTKAVTVAPTGRLGESEKKSTATKQNENLELRDKESRKIAFGKLKHVATGSNKKSPERNKEPRVMSAKSKPEVAHKALPSKDHAEKPECHTKANKKRYRDYSNDLSGPSEIAVKQQETRIKVDEARIKKEYPSHRDQIQADVKHPGEARRTALEPAVADGIGNEKKRKRSVYSEDKIDYSDTDEAVRTGEDTCDKKAMPRKGKAPYKKTLPQVESNEVPHQKKLAGTKAAEAAVKPAGAVRAVRIHRPPAKINSTTKQARKSAHHQEGGTIHREERLVDQTSKRAHVTKGVTGNAKPASGQTAFQKAHQPRRRSTHSDVPTVTDVSENSTVRLRDSPYTQSLAHNVAERGASKGTSRKKGTLTAGTTVAGTTAIPTSRVPSTVGSTARTTMSTTSAAHTTQGTVPEDQDGFYKARSSSVARGPRWRKVE